MTKEQLAALLDGRECGDEITENLRAQAKENGLVIVSGDVSGVSDSFDDVESVVEFDGAIQDDIENCFDKGGRTILLNEHGLWGNECNDEFCPYAEREMKKCKSIRSVWHDEGNPCWTFETEIPHAEFNIHDYDGRLFCVGIVFELATLEEVKNTESLSSIRCWKAGSNPPDGWYAMMFSNSEYPNRVGKIIDGSFYQQNDFSIIEQIFKIGGIFWGPIPESEPEMRK
jgi:hypothetical protein